MATTTYLRLFPAVKQFELKNGALNVGGRLFVYYEGTDDLAEIYDENGSRLQQPAILDNDGRALGLFVDAKKVYRLEVQDAFGAMQFTVRKMVPSGGGAGSALGKTYDVVSNDGSILVDTFGEGGTTTFDLSLGIDANELKPSCLKASAAPVTTDGKFVFEELVREGNLLSVDGEGKVRMEPAWYHFTAIVELSYDGTPVNEAHQVTLWTTLSNSVIDLDTSYAHRESIELSGDIHVTGNNTEFPLGVSGLDTGITASLIGFDIHAVTGHEGNNEYHAGEGITIANATRTISADFESVQEKLVAGDNISITGNVISAGNFSQEQADWTEEDTESPAYIRNKPDLDIYATQAQLSYGLAGKQDVISDLAQIRAGAASGSSAVQPSDLAAVATTGSYEDLNHRPNLTVYATKTEVNTGLATKQDVISDLSAIRAGAQAGSTAVQPADLNAYATDAELAAGLATKQDTINDLSEIRSGAAAGATALQPSDVATVATTGNYNDLSNRPAIPTNTSDLTNDSGFITSADVPVKDVQVDGASVVNAQGVAEIDLSGYATTQALNTGLAGKQDTISDLATIRSGAAAGASAVQPGDLAVVATTGSYDSLSNKPTINNVPAVTSSDNDKVLKASYSGGVGSYSWQTEQGGGSTYTAGDAIDITNDEISVLYDSDTMELKPTSETHTYELGTWYENHGSAYVAVDGNVMGILAYAPDLMLTIHIPGNTFWMSNPNALYVKFSADEYFNHVGNYLAQELSTTFDSATNTTWVDEQDIVVSSGYFINPDPEYWHIDNHGLEEANYIGIGIANGNDFCSITSAAAGAGVTMSYSAATGDPELAVKNPLPASAIGDATKVLTVDNTGAPVWATAQAPISAGTGIDITNNVVSVDTSVVATQTDLASKQDTISDLATIRSGAAEGATAVQPGDLATVATTGSYDDLSDKPTIPAAQVNSDWNSNSGVSQILNKPTLATVATTGDYADLSNKPSIPAAQVNSDWNAVSGVSEILNKPSIPTATSDLTNDSGFITLSDVPAQVNADWNSSSGASEILNKPVPKTLTAGSGISITENQSTITIANSATVDQTYSAASTNAQSGVAVASAIAALGTWTDVSSEITKSTTIITGGSITFRYNAILKLISLIGEIHVQGDGDVYTLPEKYRPQTNFTCANPGATSYIDYTPSTGKFVARSGANGYFSWTMTMPCLGE